jgi:hypothetical protein
VRAVAYDRNTPSPSATTLFGIDSQLDILVRQGGVNGVPSPNGGLLSTIGPLGLNVADGPVAFDIAAGGTAYAALTVGSSASQLYTVNLGSGAVTLVGNIGSNLLVRGLTVSALGPVIPTPTPTVTPTGTPGATGTPSATGTPGPTVTPTPFAITSEDEKDERRPETEEQRQQRQHTNRAGRDQYATEGNVIAVDQTANPPTITIANRDGNVVLVWIGPRDRFPTVKVGDYIQVDGEKIHEQLYEITDASVN